MIVKPKCYDRIQVLCLTKSKKEFMDKEGKEKQSLSKDRQTPSSWEGSQVGCTQGFFV